MAARCARICSFKATRDGLEGEARTRETEVQELRDLLDPTVRRAAESEEISKHFEKLPTKFSFKRLVETFGTLAKTP